LPDPNAGAPHGERRRCVRQKLHTPVYASFNGPQTGMVVDLSELLDLHEDGFAVQTSERLEANRAVTLCLDLPETRSFIHGTGQVIWSDDSGRGGIRFSALSDNAKHALKEWLFSNLLIACSNHQARTEQLARRQGEELPEPLPVDQSSTVAAISNRSDSASSLETIRREVREIEDDFDAVLQLVTLRVLCLTGASSAALAFLTDGKMLCRARAGEPAPPLGAPVDMQHGLSGECVRSGLMVSCDDTENDPRVDPEVSRALSIGSLMASPIVSDFKVVGLLEIFSPLPHSFTRDHATILDRLVEMIPKTPHGKTQVEAPQPEAPANLEAEAEMSQAPDSKVSAMELDSLHATGEALLEDEPEVAGQVSEQISGQFEEELPEPVPEPVPAARSRLLYRALLGLAIAVVAIVVGYMIGPIIEKRASSQASQRSFVNGAQAASPVSGQRGTDHSGPPKSLAELQALADRGDAEAQWQMAVRYHDGDGVPQSDTQAMLWFQLAAEQGNVAAQSAMGSYYWAGRGVPEDLSKAYMWSEIALAGGDKNSKARLEGLASRMTRAQISAARQQAEVWIRTHSQSSKSEAN
jgi:GAF domain/Sel1 repeat/PilZ domain